MLQPAGKPVFMPYRKYGRVKMNLAGKSAKNLHVPAYIYTYYWFMFPGPSVCLKKKGCLLSNKLQAAAVEGLFAVSLEMQSYLSELTKTKCINRWAQYKVEAFWAIQRFFRQIKMVK